MGRGSVRVIAGSLRGRRLATLPGDTVRPTSDRAREALFDILGQRVQGARFLDLCAGTGAVGIEALSRGAAEVVLVESDRRAADLVRANLQRLGLACGQRPGGGGAVLLACDVRDGLRQLARVRWVCDVAFADPPYSGGALDRTLRLLSSCGVLAPGAFVAAEHSSAEEPPQPHGLSLQRTASYGRAGLSFYRVSPELLLTT